MSRPKPITVAEIMALMRRSNESGILRDPRTGNYDTIAVILRRRGATAIQAAKAARRLGWSSDHADDWTDQL